MIHAHNHSKRGQEPSGTIESILKLFLLGNVYNYLKSGQEPTSTIESKGNSFTINRNELHY